MPSYIIPIDDEDVEDSEDDEDIMLDE